jgi:hypothetical protein
MRLIRPPIRVRLTVLPALLISLAASAILSPRDAVADPITVQGITFSDEKGSFRLVSVTGTGTMADPFVVREEITGPDDPVLVIEGFSRAFGNRVGTQHSDAFAVEKIVVNKSPRTWQGFQVELRKVETRPSSYEDGLSFGQGSQIADDYITSSLPHVQRLDEPEDSIGFGGADIPPGGAAHFRFVISDMAPAWRFYLIQRPQQPLS